MLAMRLAPMAGIQAACERIATTPLPFACTLLVHRTAYLFCLLLPFGSRAGQRFNEEARKMAYSEVADNSTAPPESGRLDACRSLDGQISSCGPETRRGARPASAAAR
jgi:hypothetical protein